MNRWLGYGFLALMVAGILVPYSAFIPFVAEHGLDLRLMVVEAAASRMSVFAWFDVLVSALVLLVAAYSRAFISGVQAALMTLLTVGAGVSAGLPLFLYYLVVRQAGHPRSADMVG